MDEISLVPCYLGNDTDFDLLFVSRPVAGKKSQSVIVPQGGKPAEFPLTENAGGSKWGSIDGKLYWRNKNVSWSEIGSLKIAYDEAATNYKVIVAPFEDSFLINGKAVFFKFNVSPSPAAFFLYQAK